MTNPLFYLGGYEGTLETLRKKLDPILREHAVAHDCETVRGDDFENLTAGDLRDLWWLLVAVEQTFDAVERDRGRSE